MARDINLRLANAADLTATGQQTAVDTEGGFFAIARLNNALITGTTPLFDFDIEASIDGGSTYFKIGSFPQLDGADDNIEIARPVYIPRPASGQTITKVRLQYTVSGTTPVCNDTTVYLEPMVSLGVPAVDEQLASGLAKLT